MTTYAIISLAGKQYRVQEGQRLVVHHLPYPDSATFHPPVLLVGGDGRAELSPQGVQVTARVVRSLLGEKIRIGKYRPKTGYRRHRGHRSRLTEIEITAVEAKAPPARKAKAERAAEPAAGEAERRARAGRRKATREGDEA